MKEMYLNWAYRSGGYKKARDVFKSLQENRPFSVDFFRKMIQFEKEQESCKMENLREYYERASKLIEGDDYQPAPAPAPAPVQQPRPVMQQTAAPAQPTVALEKPGAQAPAPAAAPAPARRPAPAQPMAPTPRRRPAQPPQGAPRRRPAGSPPPRQGSGQRRPRPAQPRPGQQPRRAPHKDANAALADLVKKMNEEQQRMGNKPE